MLTLTDFRAVVVYLRKAFLNTLGARDEHVTVCRLLLATHLTSAALLLLRLFLEQQQNWKKNSMKLKIHPVQQVKNIVPSLLGFRSFLTLFGGFCCVSLKCFNLFAAGSCGAAGFNT